MNVAKPSAIPSGLNEGARGRSWRQGNLGFVQKSGRRCQVGVRFELAWGACCGESNSFLHEVRDAADHSS